jgi:metal-responsive CopG/Arc/MetJ family transcriptional regulator
MVAVNVRIPESLLTRVDAVAECCLVSRRLVVEEAIRGLLDAIAQPKEKP